VSERPYVPDYDEVAATVARMEARFAAMDEARDLMEAYSRTVRRFESDLANPRDLALSKGAALMLIKALVERNR
jgi:hypothetical protein